MEKVSWVRPTRGPAESRKVGESSGDNFLEPSGQTPNHLNPTIPTVDDLRAAAERIEGAAHRTPVLTCGALDDMSGARLFFKCENFQKAGAFKFRGACNAVMTLTDDEARHGVLTHSSGNHAAALALAAARRGIPAWIVMPENSSQAKVRAVEAYGGKITFCAPNLSARETAAARIFEETGAMMIHPYDNSHVIAGQGTVALEFLEQQPELDVMMAPVSGGGLLSGIAIGVAAASPGTEVCGAEPEQADDAARSLREGTLQPARPGETIADGLRASLCERTFSILRQREVKIITVSEIEIIEAMRLVWERMKIVIEPSSSVVLATVLKQKEHFRGRRVGIVLTGGNVDLENLPWTK